MTDERILSGEKDLERLPHYFLKITNFALIIRNYKEEKL